MAGQKPQYRVFVSREGQDRDGSDKNYYQEIGVAWKVASNGISIQLHSLPVDGKCVAFPSTERKK